jgi:hypothetical protein
MALTPPLSDTTDKNEIAATVSMTIGRISASLYTSLLV